MSNFASIDYQLRWPRAMFTLEATALVDLEVVDNPRWWAMAERLLGEAFVWNRALTDLEAGKPRPQTPITDPQQYRKELRTDAGRRWLAKLLAATDELPEPADEPRPYWRERHQGSVERPPAGADVRQSFAELVDELDRAHYFEQAWPRYCETNPDHDHARDPGPDLESQLGESDVWPLTGSWERWSNDVFNELIEVLHDHVARSRYVIDHDYICTHGFDHSTEAGRLWYRYRVNQLLEIHDVPYRLAEAGEDIGRLVAVVDEGRADLAAIMAARIDPDTGDRVRHALAQFRARAATEHDKRSANMTLHLVLEERRKLLKAELFTHDEGALFEIANRFAIRHQNEQQKTGYNPFFLDWVFWWYLATIELTDRLLARQASEAAP